VTAVRRDLPAEPQATVEPKYGNQLLYFEAKARPDGTMPLSVTYRVKRREIKGESRTAAVKAEEELFLKPDAKVPVGPQTKPMKLVEGKQLPDEALARARVFYDLVNAHMVYSKDRPGWGRGDAEWACDSRFGNCSDFHSLFISLARSHQMPAKFEMGFPVPEKRGKGDVAGYHCWAFFKPAGAGKGWVPVDISEANKIPSMKDYYFGNLTEDRVGFSVGRDLTLVPKQDGPPLNFLIYPYVEVGGKPVPPEQVDKKFSYEDVPAPEAPRRAGGNA
jgi:transglutaminase-like putative cysteine protease